MNKNNFNPEKVTLALAILLISAAGGFVGGYYGQNRDNGSGDTKQATQAAANESELIANIVREVGPSVVSVNVKNNVTTSTVFGPREVEQRTAGTGFILNDQGVVATNRHVVPEGAEISITLSDGTKLDSIELIGRTSNNDPLDIAFLKIKDAKGKTLQPVKLANPDDKVVTGQKVVAIGNALGQFQNTVTSGIISGFGRSVQTDDSGGDSESLQNLLQTDASINQGNSGGPLVNIKGEVIGINTAVAGEGAENIGFAIPINDLQGIIKSVLERGQLLRPYLGVHFVALNDEYAYEYNLNTKRGAYLAPGDTIPIVPNSPAAKAGLKEKDIITKVNNIDVNETTSLVSALGRFNVGEVIKLTVIRDDQTITIDATLEAFPQN